MKTKSLPLNLTLFTERVRIITLSLIMSIFMAMTAQSQTTVVDIIVNSNVHESLEAAVIAAKLDGALSGDGPFTVFAPTDAAFAALGQATIDALFADAEGALAEILKYHVISGKIMAGDLSDGQIATMLEGTDAFISLFDAKAYINQAMITVTDIEADNGVVHVIDAVITQPTSIVDIVVNSPRHETLETAVIAAGLAGALSAEGTFTLFAPTDAAFAALGTETINALLADAEGALAEILKYHVVGATAFSGNLSNGDKFTTLEGSEIEVTIDNGNVFINGAQVIFADYKAPNGVVHVIDAVITPPTNTVVDIIVNSDVHESLEAAVIAAKLDGALSGDGPFTVFAPTDAAFAALGQATIDALFADAEGALAEILKYHVISGKIMAGDLSDGQIATMLEGTDAFISLFDAKAYINQAMITVTDIEADNGVVHVIDAVITQPTSIVDIVVNSPRHETLETAVIAAGLAGALSAEGTFTLFAPTDAAFAALGTETINALLADAEGALAEILKYHVVGATAFSGNLSNGDKFTTLEGSEIEVTIDNGNVFINGAQVIFADYKAPNGVVHVIDAVITPPTNTVVDIIVNSNVHESLEAAVIAAKLDGALSGDGPFTVFAPTDAAFAALGQATIDALFADAEGALAEILKYHVISGKIMAGDLSDGQIATMLEGTDAFISLFDAKAYINQAMITVTDIEADNGVVHVIDAVITQPTSIVDIVVNSPRHETLETAVIAAGLAGALSAEGTFTLFAPTDAAFAALGTETINALLADAEGALAEILKYHVVGATAFSGNLSNGDKFTTLEGSEIEVTIDNGNVFINGAQVIFADYKAPNGVVHVIDAVITPPTNTREVTLFTNTSVYPNPATDRINVRFELGNTSEVSIDMLNVTGQKVAQRNLGRLPAGTHDVVMGTDSMENGIYIVIVNSGNSAFANKVRVVR
jgi:transforming growth factor-beta-induced protein